MRVNSLDAIQFDTWSQTFETRSQIIQATFTYLTNIFMGASLGPKKIITGFEWLSTIFPV